MDTLGKRKHLASRKSMTSRRFWERKCWNNLPQSHQHHSYSFCLCFSSFLPVINHACLHKFCFSFMLRNFLCWCYVSAYPTWNYVFAEEIQLQSPLYLFSKYCSFLARCVCSKLVPNIPQLFKYDSHFKMKESRPSLVEWMLITQRIALQSPERFGNTSETLTHALAYLETV